MTRSQRIQAAKAFTEREGGLEALAGKTNYHLEEGYLKASAIELYAVGIDYKISERKSRLRSHIWGIDKQGIATTEF